MFYRVLAIFLFAVMTIPSHAAEIRVAAWNIANLHHEAGVQIRPNIGTRQFNDEGPLWRALNSDLDDPTLSKHPESVTRKCPTRKGTSTQPIDGILLDANIAHWFKEGSFWETRFKNADVSATGGRRSQRLSDHCPISIDLLF